MLDIPRIRHILGGYMEWRSLLMINEMISARTLLLSRFFNYIDGKTGFKVEVERYKIKLCEFLRVITSDKKYLIMRFSLSVRNNIAPKILTFYRIKRIFANLVVTNIIFLSVSYSASSAQAESCFVKTTIEEVEKSLSEQQLVEALHCNASSGGHRCIAQFGTMKYISQDALEGKIISFTLSSPPNNETFFRIASKLIHALLKAQHDPSLDDEFKKIEEGLQINTSQAVSFDRDLCTIILTKGQKSDFLEVAVPTTH